MPSWEAIEIAEPAFAGRVRRLFDAGRHKTLATLRADGSPRISGIECEFADGNLRFGSMAGARKGADLNRDQRIASTDRPSTQRRAKRGTGRVRRRSLAEPSRPALSLRTRRVGNLMVRCSSWTSLRW